MNEWYVLINDLETKTAPLDELTQNRLQKKLQSVLYRRQTRLRIAIVAAVLLILTACGAAAVRYADWFTTLTDPFAPEKSEDLLASMGTVIGQKQTADGVTVTLHGALYDGSTFLLSLSVEGLEEARYTSQVDAADCWLYYSQADSEQYWAEHDPENAAFYLTQYEQIAQSVGGYLFVRRQFDQDRCLLLVEPSLMPQEGREVVLHLENLTVQGQTIAGPMEFTFTPEKKEVSRNLSGRMELTTEEGVPFEVTGISITPLQIEVSVRGAGQPPEKSPVIKGIRLSGDAWTWSAGSGAWICDTEQGTWAGTLSKGHLERIVDPDTVEAIQIDGVWLELNEYASNRKQS